MFALYCLLITFTFSEELPDDYVYDNTPEPTDNPWDSSDIKFDKAKCTTCCRVIIVSDYNYVTEAQFTSADDERGDTRFALDMEFDDPLDVRGISPGHAQAVLLRPLELSDQMQWWILAPYQQIQVYTIPKRVQQINGGAKQDNRLIIWKRSPPLQSSSDNQKVVYIHPYKTYPKNTIQSKYPSHFFLSYYTKTDFCYEACIPSDWETWPGNRGYPIDKITAYQVKASVCSSDPKQLFTLIYA
ncbi:Galactose-inhibitable lectin 35 kDa subunit [Entamoeba marina]